MEEEGTVALIMIVETNFSNAYFVVPVYLYTVVLSSLLERVAYVPSSRPTTTVYASFVRGRCDVTIVVARRFVTVAKRTNRLQRRTAPLILYDVNVTAPVAPTAASYNRWFTESFLSDAAHVSRAVVTGPRFVGKLENVRPEIAFESRASRFKNAGKRDEPLR